MPIFRPALAGLIFLLVTLAVAQTTALQDARKSGFEFMGPSTQAMQKDDGLNPAMLFVKDGEALWQKPAGQSNKACISCHGPAELSMKGVAAHSPLLMMYSNAPLG